MPKHPTELVSIESFLDSCTRAREGVHLTFANVGRVDFTTITRANLQLLHRARAKGFPGIIISCPDFEREAIAIAFLAAFQHLEEGEGPLGIHEAAAGETVAVGDCVVRVSRADEKEVYFHSKDQSKGYSREYYEFPLVHRAAANANLSRTKGLALKRAAAEYEALPEELRSILDACGKAVPSIGYISSPSQYLNEAPTHILNGEISLGSTSCSLSNAMPLTYISPDGKRRDIFAWPFAADPSVVVGPRTGGVGTAYPIIESVRDGANIDFVSLNMPSPEVLETPLLSDVLDLMDMGIGVVGFCDRWTLDRMKPLKERGFLLFDWDDCEVARRSEKCSLSSVQQALLEGQHEKVMPVSAENTGLIRATEILYGRLDKAEMYTDDAWAGKMGLFRSLGAAIRMTEVPSDEYGDCQRDLISSSLEAIEASRTLSPEDFEELCEACDILSSIYGLGKSLPKEQEIYKLVTGRMDAGHTVILVVDSDKTEQVYKYWLRKLRAGGYWPENFRVINTRDYMAAKGISGNESIIFGGWYDRGTMDRAVHSGISADITFVLYTDGSGGLELGWWRRANEQWHIASDRCSKETDRTLSILGIEPIERPTKRVAYAKASDAPNDKEKDSSPAAIITEIEKRRLQKDVARKGERSVSAVPVVFGDGTHVWLRAGGDAGGGGRLVVITDCLSGHDDEPERKPASALLPGDVVLRTHSDKTYIRETSEKRVVGYQEVLETAHKWRKPIQQARMQGMTDQEIVERIQEYLRLPKSAQTVRSWVRGDRIAPQSESDIRAIFSAFGVVVDDQEVSSILGAASLIRGQHQRTGMMAHEKMVMLFLDDVKQHGLDDAVAGFDARHESGNIELLRIVAVGERMNVAVERADVI